MHRPQPATRHPLPPSRSYGTRALDQLRRYYEGQIADVMSEEEGEGAAAPAGNRSSNGPAAAPQGVRLPCCLAPAPASPAALAARAMAVLVRRALTRGLDLQIMQAAAC